MGHVLTIESDEAFALASRLAELTGVTVDQAVTTALRMQVEKQLLLQAKLDKVMALAAEFRTSLTEPMLSTDLRELYDDATGLPI